MRHIASEISKLAKDLGKMDYLSVKIASADASAEAQMATAKGSSMLYSVIKKEAEARTPREWPMPHRISYFVTKLAEVLGQPAVPVEMQHKIAAVVRVDESLCAVMDEPLEKTAADKISEVQHFGREYFVELIRKVL